MYSTAGNVRAYWDFGSCSSIQSLKRSTATTYGEVPIVLGVHRHWRRCGEREHPASPERTRSRVWITRKPLLRGAETQGRNTAPAIKQATRTTKRSLEKTDSQETIQGLVIILLYSFFFSAGQDDLQCFIAEILSSIDFLDSNTSSYQVQGFQVNILFLKCKGSCER